LAAKVFQIGCELFFKLGDEAKLALNKKFGLRQRKRINQAKKPFFIPRSPEMQQDQISSKKNHLMTKLWPVGV